MAVLAWLFKIIHVRESGPACMRPSLKFLINERDKAFSKKQWSKFNRLREEIVHHTRSLKKSFLEKAINEGSKATWQAIRNLGRFRNSSNDTIIPPDEFSSYFSKFSSQFFLSCLFY